MATINAGPPRVLDGTEWATYTDPRHPEVELRIRGGHDTGLVTVHAYCLPGYAWWTCPDAATMRVAVDTHLAAIGSTSRRAGARIPGDRMTWGWIYRYPTACRPDAACRECRNDVIDEHGMCSSCLHDAYRSGWTPGKD